MSTCTFSDVPVYKACVNFQDFVLLWDVNVADTRVDVSVRSMDNSGAPSSAVVDSLYIHATKPELSGNDKQALFCLYVYVTLLISPRYIHVESKA